MTKYAPSDCNLCPALAACRTGIVEGRGAEGYIMFVGMAPGDMEDEKRKAFVGPSGRLLALLSEAAGASTGDLYLTNAVRCLNGMADVLTKDGWQRIGKLVKERYSGDVLSYKDGRLVWSPVVNWYRRRLSEDERLVRLAPRHARRGWRGTTGLNLTSDHQVLTRDRGWVSAAELGPEDQIATGELAPNPQQASLLVGTLLGDAQIDRQGQSFVVGQTAADLVNLKAQALSDFSPRLGTRQSGSKRPRPLRVLRLRASNWLRQWGKQWYPAGHKVVPAALLAYLDASDIGLAVWFMDDGYFEPGKQAVGLAACGFAEDEVQLLSCWLNIRGFENHVVGRRWRRIRMTKRGSWYFLHRIARFVPPSLRYKLPAGVPDFDPKSWDLGVAEPGWDYCDILPSSSKPEDRLVYCLEVLGSNNFVTRGGVVHNCRPPGNRRPKVVEIRACRPYLIEEIEKVKPRVIVTLGDVALQSTLGRSVTLGSVLGQTLTQPETDIPLIPTYHPAYLLRGQWQVSNLVIGHIEKAREIADGERPEPYLGEYSTADTIEKLRILRDYLLHSDTEELAMDVETTGLDWRTDELLCISFSTMPGEGFVVPILSHRNVPRPEAPKGRKTQPPWPVDTHWDADDWPEVLEILREIFASDIKKVGQNCVFDIRFLERSADWPYVTAATAFGFEVNGQIEDTMLLHHAIAESAMPAEARRSKRNSLTVLAAQYSDLPYYEEEITAASSNKRRMSDVPDEVLWAYSAADADAVERVAIPLRVKAKAEGTFWSSEEIIQPLIRCCWEMEKRGVLVDVGYFERLCQYYRDRIADAEARLWAIKLPETEPPWKYLHSKALQRVLFRELKLPPSGIKTDSSHGCQACNDGLCFEHDGTGKDALAIIATKTDHPIIPILRELKELRKMQSTSLDGGRGGFKRHIEVDGRIRSQYRPGGAETSRLASGEPNMQNVPQRVVIEELKTENAFRQMFVAPKGHGLMEADWSQMELWVLAYTLAEEIGDNTLLEVLQSGRDIHTWAARNIARRTQGGLDEDLSDLEWQTEYPELRRQAKVFVFGVNYGLTPEGVVQKGAADTLEEAADLIAAYLHSVPGLPQYFDYIRRCILEDGYIQNKFGQRRHFPSAALLKACRRMNDLEALIREGYNYPIQSGGSTLHSATHHLTEFAPILIKRGCRPVISVHDSLVFEFYWPSDTYAETTARIVKDLWEQTAAALILPDGSRLGWQIPVDVKWGRSWGELKYSLSAKGDVRED